MKTVVLGVDERGEVRWHPVFLDFARYWGFTPRLCRAYRPQTKGKVESGIKYLRRNFLCGRSATSLPDLQQQLRVWTAALGSSPCLCPRLVWAVARPSCGWLPGDVPPSLAQRDATDESAYPLRASNPRPTPARHRAPFAKDVVLSATPDSLKSVPV